MSSPKMLHEPCPTCPWHKSVQVEHWDPSCYTNMAEEVFNGHGIMLCHSKHEKDKHICAGYAIQAGKDSIGYRLYRIRNPELEPPTCDEPLYPTFGAMMRANGVDPKSVSAKTGEAMRQLEQPWDPINRIIRPLVTQE